MASLARFVDGYVGESGATFRDAVAKHFGVSLRTVESELPRAVKQGALNVEVLPGRGAPKAYAVTPGYLATIRGKRRFRKYIDLVRSGDMPKGKTPWFEVMKTWNYDPTDRNNEFVRGFWLGVLAYCPFCFAIAAISPSEDPLPSVLWPVCGGHPAQLDEKSGKWVPRHMISAWSMGLLGPTDKLTPTAANEPRKETFAEILERSDSGRSFSSGAAEA